MKTQVRGIFCLQLLFKNIIYLSSASPIKIESENNRPAAPGSVATLPAVNY